MRPGWKCAQQGTLIQSTSQTSCYLLVCGTSIMLPAQLVTCQVKLSAGHSNNNTSQCLAFNDCYFKPWFKTRGLHGAHRRHLFSLQRQVLPKLFQPGSFSCFQHAVHLLISVNTPDSSRWQAVSAMIVVLCFLGDQLVDDGCRLIHSRPLRLVCGFTR